ncbi:hypothetical protein C2G38_2197006 [Gigaspora rosea]|uniref:Uncharacterized protein n=1 Tax=Gigaspora rosea TaxID=44941 RepID=A0A397V1E9_9GLOM|nr:hypothetical protein C2G38_2197006 [Gigaspora rosea]
MAIKRQEQREKRRKMLVEKDLKPRDSGILLRVLEMDNNFELRKKQYMDWPQLIGKNIEINALVEYRENTRCNLLKELACAICSEMFSSKHWTRISGKEIDLSLLEVDEKLVMLLPDMNFNYRIPCIDKSEYKILLDRDGFIEQNVSESGDLFDLCVCFDCKRSLNVGHVITFAQNPISLTNILPLPVYRLCDNLKVVFVGQGQSSETQLKKIDEMMLNSLPEDGIPMALMATTVVVDVDPKDIEHYIGYVTDPIDDNDIDELEKKN